MKIVTVVGARPQFIKAAAVSRAISKRPELSEIIVHTGQHFDANMSDIFFKELNIPEPRYNLDIHGGGHGKMTGEMLAGLEHVLLEEKPDFTLIYGDTNSTLAGALAAAKLHIPVAHVEAGLRSFNRQMPEELNRIVADHMSDLLFCPTSEAVKNLTNEGIIRGVHHVGDVMFDAVKFAKAAATEQSDILHRLQLTEGDYGVCTIHRAENTDDPERLAEIVAFLERHAASGNIVFPIHPRTKAAFERNAINPVNLILIDPIGYMDINCLMASANNVYTDSGGLQKEAYFHGVPCVTLREETEWVETIAHGWNRLWREEEFISPRREIAEYGSGASSELIVDTLLSH